MLLTKTKCAVYYKCDTKTKVGAKTYHEMHEREVVYGR